MQARDASRSEFRRYYRVDRRQIGYLRFVLEGYEGIAQMRSLPGRSEVEWLIPSGFATAACQLAESLRDEIGLTPIAKPSDWQSP